MLKIIPQKLAIAAIASLALISSVEIPQLHPTQPGWLTLESTAQARSSGGRSGGGSFSRGSSSRSSSPSRSKSYSTPSRRYDYDNDGDDYRRRRVTPGYSYGGGYYSGGGTALSWAIILPFIVFGLSGIVIFLVIFSLFKSIFSIKTSSNPAVTNDTVTISKLQIALLASATNVQSALSELSLGVDTDTNEGLRELLQESVLVLLRHSEYWSHVWADSEPVVIDKAEARFSQLSLSERSNFSAETLRNVGGKLWQQTVIAPENESAQYIVVTLLAGTAHDRPLFTKIQTIEAVKAALENLAATPPDYLFKFELMWTPQAASDSLSYDEFITEYTNMVQLA